MNRSLRTLLTCALSLVALAVFANAASATNYCVGPGSDCDQTFTFDVDGFNNALSAVSSSDPEIDRIYLAAGTLTFNDRIDLEAGLTGEFVLNGAGSDKTKLVFDDVGGDAVRIEGGEINDLSIESNAATDGNVGLRLTDGNAEDVYSFMSPGANAAYEFLGHTRCIRCRAKVSGGSATGFLADGESDAYVEEGKAEVYDADPEVPTRGVSVLDEDANIQLERTLLKGFNRGVFQYHGQVRITNSVVDLGNQDDAIGLSLDSSTSIDEDYLALIDAVTVVGTGARQKGVELRNNGGGDGGIEVEIDNSLIWLPGALSNELICYKGPSSTQSILFLADFVMAEDLIELGCGISESNLVTGTPTFVDSANGDYRPASGSPVIDAGNPGSNDRGPFDFWGGTRYVNGSDFNFSGNIDLGAGEYQNYAPNKPQVTATPSTVVVGQPVTLSANGTDPNGDAVTFTWAFYEGGSASGATTARTYTAPGTYKVKAIASDGEFESASDWATITVTEAPPTPSIVFGKPSGKFKYVKGAKNGFKLSTKKPKGASIKLTTSGAATSITLTLRKKGKKLKGSQKLSVPVGKSYLSFGGKWNKKQLASGKYELRIAKADGSTAKATITYTAKKGKTGSAK